MPDIETMNKFMVAAGGNGFRILRTIRPNDILTADDCLLLAAYLVVMAEHEASHDFSEVLKAIQNT